MRTLIACEDESVTAELRRVLARGEVECPPGYAVRLEMAADRASRVLPELLVFVLPNRPSAGLEPLREVCQTVAGMHVLVLGPVGDSRLILQTLHQGGDEYLDAADIDGELTAALARFKLRRSATPQAGRSGRIVGVMAASGGSGASLLAANIAANLAAHYGECALVDLRLEAGDLTALLDLRPQHTLADFCDRVERVDAAMFEQFFARHESGVHLLAAPVNPPDIDRVTEKGVRRTLTLSRVRFPFAVVDLDNRFHAEQVEALWQADAVLLVLRLDYTSVRNTRRVMDHMAALGLPLDRVELVVNHYGQRKQLHYRQAEEALGKRLAHYIPFDPARVNKAINKGIPVALYYPSATISRRIAALAASVNGLHYPPGGKH